MDAPAALQRHADSIVTGKFRDTDKLWAALQSSDAAAARLCKQAKTVGPLNQKILDALAIVLGKMQKTSTNRGRKNLSRAAKPSIPSSAGSVPKGAGKGNGEPQLYDMILAEEEVFFVNGEPAPRFDLREMMPDTTGVAYTTATQAGIALRIAQQRPTRKLQKYQILQLQVLLFPGN